MSETMSKVGPPNDLPPPSYQAGYPPQGAPVQGQGYVVTQGQPMPVIVTNATGPQPGSIVRYGQVPAIIICQHCQATVTTSMTPKDGLVTWIAAGGLCLLGCWLGCCLIPFCVDSTKDVEHRCPNCHNIVGVFRHI